MLKLGLEPFIPYFIYIGGILAALLSIGWRPEVGLYYIVPLLPLQQIRFRMHREGLPGADVFVDAILLAVTIGLVLRGQNPFPKNAFVRAILVLCLFTYVSLWLGSFALGVPPPLWFDDRRLQDWKNVMIMPFMFFLTVAAIRTPRQMKIFLILLCLGVAAMNVNFRRNAIVGRDYSTFSYMLRTSAAMGYAGINGLAAFEAQMGAFLYGLSQYERFFPLRIAYLSLAAFCAYCLMYSLSRGAYAAALVVWVFFGLAKKRKLLIWMILFLLTWQFLVPNAVRERVLMTYHEEEGGGGEATLESSAERRVEIWEDAMQLIQQNPLLGYGYNTYAYMGRVAEFQDTHNLYVEILVETGIVGLLIFLWLWARFLWGSFRLWRTAPDPFLASVGFGFMAYMVCFLVVNLFGDRWNYIQISGYTWVLAGLVARGLLLTQQQLQQTPASAVPPPVAAPLTPARAGYS